MRGLRIATTLLGCVVVSATRGAADNSIPMLLPGEKVQSALAATGEKKTVAFAGVEGSTVRFDAKAVKGGQVVPTLSLTAPDGSSVDVGATNPKGRGAARIAPLRIATTGVWRVGVQTPSGKGGAVTLSAKSKTPLKFGWSGTLAEDGAPAEHEFAAAPGGSATVVVSSKAKPRFDPSFDLVSPGGAVIAHADGVKGRAALARGGLAELGRYVVRVAGGPGAFSAKVVVTPAKRRTPTYKDVEARPEILSFAPTEVANDAVVTIVLQGVGFSGEQSVTVSAGTASKAAKIKSADATGAAVDLNLDDVPAGAHALAVTTTEGNVTTAAAPLVVTNRVPGVASISPPEVTNKYPVQFDVRGAGFDATASVFLRRASDGASVPLVVDSRDGHVTILATATPPAWFTGRCDLEIRDPDGAHALVAGGVDLLGFRAAPATLRAASGPHSIWARDAAYDETNGRVLVAMAENQARSVFALIDPATSSVLDTLTITGFVVPRVAWNPRDGTFALTCVGTGANAYVRVVSAANVHSTVAERTITTGNSYQLCAAQNTDTGGYLLVWDDYDATTKVTNLFAQAVAANGAFGPTNLVASHAKGYLWEPVCAYQGAGRTVVAWGGATADDLFYCLRHTVLDALGLQTADAGPYYAATSKDWYALFQPELAANPDDGSMLLAFSYYDVSDVVRYRLGSLRLAPVSALPDAYHALDDNGLLPEGLIDSLVWNPTRSEFVVALTNSQNRVAVRRVNADGSIRRASYLESYEGEWGILWAGTAADTLGLARTIDDADDDVYNPNTFTPRVIAGPTR